MSQAALNQARLNRKAAGRQAARTIIELAKEIESPNPDWQTAFWDEMMEWFRKESLPPRPQKTQESMTDAEARKFGEQEMRFGKYNGRRIGEVDLEYLDWLLGQSEDLVKNLRRYLTNEKVAERLRRQMSDQFHDSETDR